MLEYEHRHLRITFTSPLLATSPASRDLYSKYVIGEAEKAGISVPESRAETIMDIDEAGRNMFPRIDGDWDQPAIYGYQFLGYLKEAAKAANRSSKSSIRKTRGFLKAIKFELHIKPFITPLILPDGAALDLEYVERPIRANTPKGARTALKASEKAPAGSIVEITIKRMLHTKLTWRTIQEELLRYGEDRGMGGWRDAGFGTFTVEEL